jgi:2-hydroxy-6-oxonona-2,4-dienedioate hydrolase
MPVLLREYLAAGLPRTIRTLQYAFADCLEEHLPHVQVPTLIVRGSRDPIVSQDWAEEVKRLLPAGSQLGVTTSVGHAVNFNAPEQLVRSIRSFLSE